MGLSSNWIVDIIEDKSEQMWVATTAGVNVIDTSTEIINTYTEKDGLSNNSITEIFIDSKNRILVSYSTRWD